MSGERRLSFVDTNILVYAFEKGNSLKSQLAQNLLKELMDQGRLQLSTQVLQELFVTLTRKKNPVCSTKEALTALDELAAWPVRSIDFAAIRAAVELADRAIISFWDALIVVTAARSGAAVLYTEDLNDGQEILGVRIVNPFTA